MTRVGFEKQDRVLRLLREVTLFQAVPYGLTSVQLAERMEINQRTAQRDIAALESELRVPFIKHGARWQITAADPVAGDMRASEMESRMDHYRVQGEAYAELVR